MASVSSPDSDSFVEDVIEYIMDTLSSEDLQQLLTEDGSWEILVETTDLTREEADAVRETLTELEAHKERFLNAFPHVKKELEEGIAKLYGLADKVDKVHKDCTITNVVASSTGAVSGILTILSLALAPVTAGGSLVLLATGIGLGAAASVTDVSSSIVDHLNKLSAKTKAKDLLSTSMDTEKEVFQAVGEATPKVASAVKKCVEACQAIGKNICAIKSGKCNPRLLANANLLMTTGKISARSGKQVQRALGGTVLAMSKGARIMGAVTAGIFFLVDVYNLVEDSVHLHKGAKTESAEELRQQAQVLERKLEELIRIHESLQSDLTK
ncbi:apolipoprotein L2-like isoform X2 [Heterocephalus glaber]|uniref:Apolipoprotein L2-like isoform X2 n=1 Tax=Heterocephalus glaber TaxID=10181 RepID=A0AAX6SXL8_HETGA|nr:apolipoprotein L2-like isoform X2 [Heterocephalus glaber]XP_021114716.1 apolipoprotein L2-like isoform X2 [Heterocephalus glaber]XP_021114717.1 apolipoprotein L2-like isoform X2 [Heterocephalus glaber]